MSQFCPEEKGIRRCVLAKNHIGEHSLQSKSSASVRQIEKREEIERKYEEA